MNNADLMSIKYGPCDRCGAIIKPCRCTLLADRDALAEQVAELQAENGRLRQKLCKAQAQRNGAYGYGSDGGTPPWMI